MTRTTAVARTPLGLALAGRFLAVLLATAVLAGCASGAAPAQEAPSLASTLARVDSDVAAGHLLAARANVETLVTETKRARERGDISTSQADQILAAARSVLAELPAAVPRRSASPTPPAIAPGPASPANTPTPPSASSGPGPAGRKHPKPGKKHQPGPPGQDKKGRHRG